MERNKKTKYILISSVAALVVWQIVASVLNKSIILPSPFQTAEKLIDIISRKGFSSTMFSSVGRIIAGFLAGMLFGGFFGVAAGKKEAVEIILKPYMAAVKSVPVVSFIVLALMLMPSEKISVFIAFLISLPVAYTNILGGIKSLDKDLEEMADLFKVSKLKKVFCVRIPQLKAELTTACSLAIGLSVKAGIAAELIGLPQKSIGEAIYEAKVYFMTSELFAWTVIIIITSIIIEKVLLLILKLLFKGIEKS